jgi:hypothetical protein
MSLDRDPLPRRRERDSGPGRLIIIGLRFVSGWNVDAWVSADDRQSVPMSADLSQRDA